MLNALAFTKRVCRLQWLLVLGALLAAASPVRGAEIDAAALYDEHCATCHGGQGDAQTRVRHGYNPPPRDFTTEAAAQELSRQRMIRSVTQGRPGTAMAGFGDKLSEAQIAAVVDYIRGNFMMDPDQVTVTQEALRVSQGKRIYLSHCAVCHGDEGSGAMWTQTSLDPAPRDFTSAEARRMLSRERMISSVTHGRPGTAMMPFASRLSEEEIRAVVSYIRTKFMQPAEEAAPKVQQADMSKSFPGGLKGDRRAGKAFYMDNCAACHGEEGKGDGPRASFIEPKPRNFLAAESQRRLNRPALYEAIARGVTGTVMPAWRTVLSDQEIANVAEFVFQDFIQGDAATRTSKAQPTAKKKVDQLTP